MNNRDTHVPESVNIGYIHGPIQIEKNSNLHLEPFHSEIRLEGLSSFIPPSEMLALDTANGVVLARACLVPCERAFYFLRKCDNPYTGIFVR